MSQDKAAKDFELDDLEKPLTEKEMKEAAGGGAGERTPIVKTINGEMVIVGYEDPRSTGQWGYVPSGISAPPPIQAPPQGTLSNLNGNAPKPSAIVPSPKLP